MPVQVATTYTSAVFNEGDDIGTVVESMRATAIANLGGAEGVNVHEVSRPPGVVGVTWRRVWNDDPPPEE